MHENVSQWHGADALQPPRALRVEPPQPWLQPPYLPRVATQHDSGVLAYPLLSGLEVLLPHTDVSGMADAMIKASVVTVHGPLVAPEKSGKPLQQNSTLHPGH